MIRGTFANIRLRNQLAAGTEGGVTRHLPDGEQMSIYDAAERYQADGVPLVVLAGKEYGSGSSRDWAAKGTALLGVRAVLAESFERIHRSNLVGMGILPLQFQVGDTAGLVGPHRRGGLRHHRPRRAGRRCAAAGHLDRNRRRPDLPGHACASTRPRRRSTSATAGSCSTYSAGCEGGTRPPDPGGPPTHWGRVAGWARFAPCQGSAETWGALASRAHPRGSGGAPLKLGAAGAPPPTRAAPPSNRVAGWRPAADQGGASLELRGWLAPRRRPGRHLPQTWERLAPAPIRSASQTG